MMPTMHAALGLQQFRRMSRFGGSKRWATSQYSQALSGRGDVWIPREAAWAEAT